MVTLRTRPIAFAALLLVPGTAPAQTGPAKADRLHRTPMVKADTPVPTSPASEDPPALAIQRPDVDLAPPPPVPLIVLTRTVDEPGTEYRLEISKDGSVRFLGRFGVCVQGEETKQVSSAIIDEATRLVRKSHVFDRGFEACSGSWTDDGLWEIYFAEPAPGRVVRALDSCRKRRVVTKLARALEKLVDATPWIEPSDRSSCRPWSFWRSLW